MEIRALGPLEVVGDETDEVRGRNAALLLACLLVDPGRPVSADRLEAALWGDDPPKSASHALHVYVSRLRDLLGREPEAVPRIATVGDGYRIDLDPDHYDVLRFERLITEAEGSDAASALVHLNEALGLWRGRPFGALADEEPIRIEVERLEQLRLRAVEKRFDAALETGRAGAIVGEIEEELSSSPFRERMWQQLMLALYRDGRQAEALRAFARLRSVLGDELGIEPQPETRDLERRILLQDPGLDQVGSGAQGNLPHPLTPLFGRDADIGAVGEALVDARLVTLHGPPGIGKSRIALASAWQADPRGGVWHVDLTGIGASELVVTELAHSMGIERRVDDPIEAIATRVGDAATLVVLDGCERVIDEARRVAGSLLRRCGGVRVLATSVVSLDLAGERIVPVGPLPVKDAVALFLDRAREIPPESLHAVEAVCERLDGVPLAIELAAARSDVLTPSQILERLDQRLSILQSTVEGDRPLDAAIEWTMDLLPAPAVETYARLAVFHEGLDLEAAEAVNSDSEVVDALSMLVAHSLILTERRGGTVRYRMLGAIRQHALSRLEEMGQLEPTRDAHALHYRTWARQAQRGLMTTDQLDWLVRMDAERDNIRAALSHLLEAEETHAALDLVADASWYWFLRSHLQEGWYWLERVLSTTAGDQSVSRVRALIRAGQFAWEQGSSSQARIWLVEASDLAAQLDLPVQGAWAGAYTALLELIDGDDAAGYEQARRARSVFEATGNPAGVGFTGFVEALAPVLPAWRAGEHDPEQVAEGYDRLATLAEVARVTGERNLIGHLEWGLGTLATTTGDLAAARDHLTVAMRNLIELGNLTCLCHVLDSVALTLARASEPRQASFVLGMVESLRARVGVEGHAFERLLNDRALGLIRESAPADVDAWIRRGEGMALDEVLTLAWEGGSSNP